MAKFQRIYWSGAFDWKKYAGLYAEYCKTSKNYYIESSKRLVNAVKIPSKAHIIDAGAGTGMLTQELLKKKPFVSITAIELSKEMLFYYKKKFKKQISSKQIKVHRGNAEKLHNYIKKPVDLIFVSSALWDMELLTFFKNAHKVLKPNGRIVFNLPSLVLGEETGFINFIEQAVRKEIPGKKLYRRILVSQLKRIFKQSKFTLSSLISYKFPLSKQNISQFFQVLRYRYPFILFPKEMTYKARLKQCTKIFSLAAKKLPKKGLKEEGKIFVVKKK